jgi:hypothetical protein
MDFGAIVAEAYPSKKVVFILEDVMDQVIIYKQIIGLPLKFLNTRLLVLVKMQSLLFNQKRTSVLKKHLLVHNQCIGNEC